MADCARCHQDNPDGFILCGFCAAPLRETGASSDEERKVVTILFCDLVGFTARSDGADPEDVRARIRPYFARLRPEIKRHGGTVEKYVGDAIMAVFGAPFAHEDDPERAVRAGLRILEALTELNREEAGLDLRVRIGIETGDALVTLDARPEKGEGIVTGDVVNTASRIQGAAPIDGVAVGARTYAATRELVEYQALEPVILKGKTMPVPIFLAKSVRPPHRLRAAESTTPLVGREPERALLIEMFEQAVRDRSVQLVTIVGEPGIGKSRLVTELSLHVDENHQVVRWRQGRCLPYGDAVTFWALGEIVKAEAGIAETDSQNGAAQKIHEVVPSDHPEAAWLRQRLRPLVGLEAPQASREENFTAWRTWLESLAEGTPTILVFEDLHWANEALLAFVEHFADKARRVPMLLVGTARPEVFDTMPTFSTSLRNSRRINLSALPGSEIGALVATLLDQAGLPEPFRSPILERSGGNPLFVHEFVRLLKDRGALSGGAGLMKEQPGELPLPESIAATIAARLDILPRYRKAILADAAVIGKVFWAGGVAAIGDIGPEIVGGELGQLVRKEFIQPSRPSSMPGETEFAFSHALIRDVAYAQIPRAARSRRHRKAAAWIEATASDRLEDLSEVLAHHYTSALDLARAAGRIDEARELEDPTTRFLILAGDRAMALDPPRAETYYRRAAELAPKGQRRWATALGRLAELVQMTRGDHAEAASLFEQAIAAHEEIGDAADAIDLMLRLKVVIGARGDAARASSIVEVIISRLERDGPSPQLARAYAERAFAVGRWDTLPWADRALELADRLGLPDVHARALGFRGVVRANLGERGGIADLRDSVAVARRYELTRQTYVSYCNLMWALIDESPPSVLELAEEALTFVRARGLGEGEARIRTYRLRPLFQLGRWQEVLEEADRLAGWAEPREDRFVTLYASYPKAQVLVATGGLDEAGALATALGDEAKAAGMFDVFPLPLGAWHQACGRAPEATLELEAFIERQEQTSGRLGEFLCDAARQAAALGRLDLLARCGRLAKGDFASDDHRRSTFQGIAALAEDRHDDGVDAFGRAARGWEAFGNPYEQAHALLGLGRCLLALRRPNDAATPLQQARTLFASLCAAPALAEVDALLEEAGRLAR
jgi:class 3 adenylate cyclase/tetratricopeptide (TPR) repeat protein